MMQMEKKGISTPSPPPSSSVTPSIHTDVDYIRLQEDREAMERRLEEEEAVRKGYEEKIKRLMEVILSSKTKDLGGNAAGNGNSSGRNGKGASRNSKMKSRRLTVCVADIRGAGQTMLFGEEDDEDDSGNNDTDLGSSVFSSFGGSNRSIFAPSSTSNSTSITSASSSSLLKGSSSDNSTQFQMAFSPIRPTNLHSGNLGSPFGLLMQHTSFSLLSSPLSSNSSSASNSFGMDEKEQDSFLCPSSSSPTSVIPKYVGVCVFLCVFCIYFLCIFLCIFLHSNQRNSIFSFIHFH